MTNPPIVPERERQSRPGSDDADWRSQESWRGPDHYRRCRQDDPGLRRCIRTESICGDTRARGGTAAAAICAARTKRAAIIIRVFRDNADVEDDRGLRR